MERYKRSLEEQHDFMMLAEESPNMIFINVNGKVIYTNKKTEDMMGYSREEVCSPDFDFRELIDPVSLPLIARALAKHAEGEEVEPYEYSLITKSGKKIEAIITTKLIEHEGEKGVLGIVTDISALKKTERDLAIKNKELESFVYTISHDLKSPLVSLKGFLNLLKEELAGHAGEKCLEYMTRMGTNIDNMERQIQDLLRFARIGRLERQKQLINVGDLLREVAGKYASKMSDKNIKISIVLGQPVSILAEPCQITHMMENLVDNAVKFMGESRRKEIELSCERDNSGNTCICVRDTGIGIDPKYHDKIFDIFYRLDDLGQHTEGTGVGLAIVKKIVQEHEGKIQVKSEKGGGTEFRIELSGSASLIESP